MEKEIINLLSYIKISENRKKTLLAIDNNILTSSEISKKSNIISDRLDIVLRGLKDKGLIKCLNEEEKRGKVYTTTELGKIMLKYFERDEIYKKPIIIRLIINKFPKKP